MKLKFAGKIWKAGNSFVVTIPSDYINNGLVPEDKELDFSVEVADGVL